jgi:hypothetical protein
MVVGNLMNQYLYELAVFLRVLEYYDGTYTQTV